jgi:hypothetical protein
MSYEIALVVVGCAFVYAVLIGVTRELFGEAPEPKAYDVVGITFWWWCAAIVWPGVLPAMGGIALVRWMRRPRAVRIPKATARERNRA